MDAGLGRGTLGPRLPALTTNCALKSELITGPCTQRLIPHRGKISAILGFGLVWCCGTVAAPVLARPMSGPAVLISRYVRV